MLNLSHNKLGNVVGLSSMQALIALNLGKSVPPDCHSSVSLGDLPLLSPLAAMTAGVCLNENAGLVGSVSFSFESEAHLTCAH
jgi:hypothetical protein